MSGVLNQRNGVLRWVAAPNISASAWATASAPASGVVGFVRSFSHDSGRTMHPVMDRGNPHHQIEGNRNAINVTFQMAYIGTGFPTGMVHLELRMSGNDNEQVHQYLGAAYTQENFSEAETENTMDMTWQALAMLRTGSAFLG